MDVLEEVFARILPAIEEAKARDELVDVYAELIAASVKVGGTDRPEVPEVNLAITAKWSKAGLLYVKGEAWKRVRW